MAPLVVCTVRAWFVQDDAEGVVPDIVTGKGKKGSKQNKDQTQMRISNMKVNTVPPPAQNLFGISLTLNLFYGANPTIHNPTIHRV